MSSDVWYSKTKSLLIFYGLLNARYLSNSVHLLPLAGSGSSFWPYVLAVCATFTVMTMWAVVVTEGCRKIMLQYYGFKLASATRLCCFAFLDRGHITQNYCSIEKLLLFYNLIPTSYEKTKKCMYLICSKNLKCDNVKLRTSYFFLAHKHKLVSPHKLIYTWMSLLNV